jgi:O-antigen/teichoic acid export membrane protein
MRSGGMLKVTMVACVVLAAATVVGSALTGHLGFGVGLATGLVLGSFNGYAIQGLLARRAPFRVASLMRLVAFSALVLIAVVAFGPQAWTVPLGIGLAQLVMVAAGVRQGLRA